MCVGVVKVMLEYFTYSLSCLLHQFFFEENEKYRIAIDLNSGKKPTILQI